MTTIKWHRDTAQSLIDFEPDDLFQPATQELEDALKKAIQEAGDSGLSTIVIEISP